MNYILPTIHKKSKTMYKVLNALMYASLEVSRLGVLFTVRGLVAVMAKYIIQLIYPTMCA